MRLRKLFLGVGLLTCLPLTALANDYNPQTNPQIKEFIQQLHTEKGLDKAKLEQAFSQTNKRQDIIDLISRPAERVLAWHEYRKIFMTERRVREGKEFMQQYADVLAKAEKEFGIPKEIITAIIGVETFYGRNKGKHRVIDALSTLGFDYPPRAKFFKRQLEEFLVITHKANLDPLLPLGSYAGAMGFPQFIPTSYTSFAVDFDGDGFADIWTNPADAIGSVANYFKEHKWQTGKGVLEEVASIKADANLPELRMNRFNRLTLKEIKQAGLTPKNSQLSDNLRAIPMAFATSADKEVYYLGLHNFYVITRYNHSRMYALAVHQLATELAN